jgi:hypothetical protein
LETATTEASRVTPSARRPPSFTATVVPSPRRASAAVALRVLASTALTTSPAGEAGTWTK